MKRNIIIYGVGVVVFFILTILSLLFEYPQGVTFAAGGSCSLLTIVCLYITYKTAN